MKIYLLLLFGMFFILWADRTYGNPLFDYDAGDGSAASDYSDNTLDRLLHVAQEKRACVRRGRNCDHRPNACCYNSSCRCNLWGSNCRCQRMGVFQKWG